MKLGGGWMWPLLLLLSLAVAAHKKRSEADPAYFDDDVDEDELQALLTEDEEEATVMDEEQSDEKSKKEPGKTGPDVSFQVTYKTPVPTGDVYFAETFDDGSLDSQPLQSEGRRDQPVLSTSGNSFKTGGKPFQVTASSRE